jgi:hypothetical protein
LAAECWREKSLILKFLPVSPHVTTRERINGFLGAFAKFRKAITSVVMSVCPHGTTRLYWTDFNEIGIREFSKICRENIEFDSNLTRMTGTVREELRTFIMTGTVSEELRTFIMTGTVREELRTFMMTGTVREELRTFMMTGTVREGLRTFIIMSH